MADPQPPDEILVVKTKFGDFNLSANDLAMKLNKILVRSEVYIGLHNTVCASYNDLKAPNGLEAQVAALRTDVTELKEMMKAFLDLTEDPNAGAQPQNLQVPPLPPGN